MLKVVEDEGAREAGEEPLLLDEVARRGARLMLIAALETEAPIMWSVIVRRATNRDGRWWCTTAERRHSSLRWGKVEPRTPAG